MINANVEKIIEDMKKTTKKITASKNASREFLVKAGICDKDGKLTKEYGGS